MANKQDYYQVLGISKDASADAIKKAYRRFAMKYHPDRNAGDGRAEEKFKEVREAYDVLSDERKRAAYDQFGHAGVDASTAGGNFNQGAGFGDIFDSVFGDIFGGSRSHHTQHKAYRGADLRYDLELSLEDAVLGTTVKIRIPKTVLCRTCSGSGMKRGSTPVTCKMCSGQGQIRMQQGFFSVQQTCPKCRGQGQIISDPCHTCRGQRKIRENKTISVKVPEGIDTGDQIRLAGEGEAGERKGISGDLYVHILVKEHPIFTREGNHLYCDIPINFTTAALGGALEVPTLGGRVRLKIPPETQSGKLFRLRGEGVKSVRNPSKGDLLCRVAIETPIDLNSEQKNLLKQFEKSMQANSKKHSPKSNSWLAGVKRFFDSIA